jgi:putative tryptophan/tyrosine transport system substrate-binding protein
MPVTIRRRELIAAIGGAMVAWPFAARAQQGGRMRRIGVLTTFAEDDPEGVARNAAFLQALAQLGWTDGRNVRMEYRRGASDPDRIRKYAAELAALAPDVILATGNATLAPLLQATRTVPIVFAAVADPVGAASIAWHGRVATPPVSSCSNTASAANGWNCSKRSHRALSERQSFGIPP